MELFNTLQPYTGTIAALAIIALVFVWRYMTAQLKNKDDIISLKDKEIERLRDERNTSVERERVRTEASNEKVIALQKDSINTGHELKEAITALKTSVDSRDEAQKVRDTAIIDTMRGLQQVLSNIKN